MAVELDFDIDDSSIEFDSPVKRSLAYGTSKDPDKHARALSISETERLPVDIVERNMTALEVKSRKPVIDFDGMEAANPMAARALSDPDTAAIAHDDIGNMLAIERIYKKQHKNTLGARHQRAVEKGARSLDVLVKSLRSGGMNYTRRPRGISDKAWDERQASAAAYRSVYEEQLREASKKYSDIPQDIKIDEFSNLVESVSSEKGTAEAIKEGVKYIAKNPSILSVLLAEQVVPMLVAAPAGGATGIAVKPLVSKIANEAVREYATKTAVMAGVNFSSSAVGMYGGEIAEGLSKGMEVDAALARARTKTLTESGVNALFAFIPTAGGKLAQTAQETLKQGVAGATGATAGAMSVGEDITLSELMLEFFGEMTTAPVDVAVAGIATRRDRVEAKEQARILSSSIDQMKIDEIAEVAKLSKLGDRKSDRFKKFMQTVVGEYGEDAQVYIDGDEISDLIGDMNQDIPVVQEMQRQLNQGGDIVIPLEDYIADVARSEISEQIRPLIRMDIDGLSQVELEEAAPLMEKRISELMAQAESVAANETKIDEISEDIFSQLMETGRVSQQVARASSKIIPAYVSARASEYNMTADEMYQRLGFGGVKAVSSEGVKQDNNVAQDSLAQKAVDKKKTTRATFDVETRTIELLEQSDPTSFIHESGHLFLEMERQLSGEFGVSDGQKSMLKWLGVESFDDIDTKQHEQFARGFEAYVFEGKSPSHDLAAVFASFRRWMLEIYKRVTRLDVTLTPEIRSFFDHMLATDAQIEDARRNPAYDQFFRDAESAGMTEKEWSEYTKRREESKIKAEQTLEGKVLAALRRKYTKEWKAERSEMQAQIHDELMQQDTYRVIAHLRGELTIDDKKSTKLNRKMVDETLGLLPDKKKTAKEVDPKSDSLLIAIAKLGGLDRNDAEAEGIDPANWKGAASRSINQPVFGKRVFKKGGKSFDHMRENLSLEGYVFENINELLDAVHSEMNGSQVYSDRVDYDEIYGDDKGRKRTPMPRALWGVTNKNGVDPDELALDFGFSNGHEMLTTIISTPEIHEVSGQMANERMIRKHGDILNDGTIEQEARDAAQNESKAIALMTEIRALNKKLGRPQDIDRAALKSGAARTIASAKISDIRPNRFYRAEIKAAQKAASAIADNNTEEARNLKVQQLANHYLYREATEAQKKVITMRRYISGVKTKKLDPKKVDPEYINQMKLLASAYDFSTGKRNEDQAKQRLIGLASWIDAQIDSDLWVAPQFLDPTLSEMITIKRNDSLEPHEKADLIQKLRIPRYDEMTMEQMSGAYEMIKNLRYVGGRLSASESEAFNAKAGEVGDSILKHGGKDVNRPQEQSTAYKISSALKQFGAEHIVLGNAIAEMDGYESFGSMFTSFYQDILDSTNNELALKREVHGKLEEIFGKFRRKDLAKGFRESGHAGHRQITKEDGSKWSLSRRGRLMLAMYWGSPEGREALIAGNKVTETDVQLMLNTLTDKELDFVQSVWGLNESLWPQVKETALKMTGVAPPKVEHSAFTVNGREMPGGYIRLYYDYDAKDSYLAGVSEDGTLTRSGGHVMKDTKHGSRNERVGSGGRPVSLELDNIFRALDENIHDIAFAETARDSNRLLRAKPVRDAIVSKYGKEKYESIIASLEGVVAGNFASNHPVNSFLRYLRTNASYAFLGYSIRNLVQQPVALTNVIGKIGEKNTLKGIAEFVFNPAKARDRVEWIQDRSEFMRHRTSLVNRETAEIANKLDSGILSGPLKRHAFDLQTMGDAVVAYPAWYASYLKGMAEFNNEKRAATYADEVVAQTIGSGLMKDLSPMMQGSGQLKVIGPELLKSITFMGSFFNKVANLTVDAYKQNDLRTVRGGAEFTRQMSWYLMIPAVVSAMLVDSFPDEDDDEGWLAWGAERSVEYGLAQMFIIRDLVYLWNGFTPSTPYTRAVAEAGRTVKLASDIGSGEKELDAEAVAKLTRNVSAFVPLPGAGQAARTIEGTVDASEGNDRNLYQMLVEGKER